MIQTNNFKMVSFNKRFVYQSAVKNIELLKEKALQKMDLFLEISGLRRWLSNWVFDSHIYDESSSEPLVFFSFLRISYFETTVSFFERSMVPFLNDVNDVSEWRELLNSCWKFSVLMIESLFQVDFHSDRDLPSQINNRLNIINDIRNYLEVRGEVNSLIVDEFYTILKLRSGLNIKLMRDIENDFSGSEDLLEETDIFSGYLNFVVNNPRSFEKIEEHLNATKLSNIFTTTTDHFFDPKSEELNVDLDWNFESKNYLYSDKKIILYKTPDGFIGKRKGISEEMLFRMSLRELLNDLGVCIPKNNAPNLNKILI